MSALSTAKWLLLTVERNASVEGRMDRLDFCRHAMVLGLSDM